MRKDELDLKTKKNDDKPVKNSETTGENIRNKIPYVKLKRVNFDDLKRNEFKYGTAPL